VVKIQMSISRYDLHADAGVPRIDALSNVKKDGVTTTRQIRELNAPATDFSKVRDATSRWVKWSFNHTELSVLLLHTAAFLPTSNELFFRVLQSVVGA
jgi:hypothetical protein